MIHPYLLVLRTPHAARLMTTAFASALWGNAVLVPLIFFARDATGSFAGASAVLAGQALGSAGGSPWRGRLLDTHGPRLLLPLFGVAKIASTAALLIAGHAGAPTLVLAVLGVVTGVTMAVPGGVLRAIWGQLFAESEHKSAAFALITVMWEVANLGAPLLGAALLLVISPTAAVAIATVLCVAGSVAFARSPGSELAPRAEPGAVRGLGPLVSPGFRALTAIGFFSGVTFGQLEDIALPAFAVEHGSRASSGILLAAVALGIGAGGFVYGLRKWPRAPGELMPLACAVAVAGLVPALLVDSIAAMAIAMLAAGVCVAPAMTLQFAVVDDVVPAGSANEAFGWLTGMAWVGAAVGAVIAGQLVDSSGPEAGIAGAAVAAALAFGVSVVGRRQLALRLSPEPS